MSRNFLIGLFFIGGAILLIFYNLYRRKKEYNYVNQGVMIKSWIAVIIGLFVGFGLILEYFD